MMEVPPHYRSFNSAYGQRQPTAKSECMELIKVLGYCFNKELREQTLNHYAETLLKYNSVDNIKQACEKLKITARFFPSINEIHETARAFKKHTGDDKEGCKRCSYTGFILTKKTMPCPITRENKTYQFASRCHCELGNSMSKKIPLL